MTTKKLYITDISDAGYVHEKQVRYSYAFRRLWKMLEEAVDPSFVSRFMDTFQLNDIEYRSLLSEVKSFKERYQKDRESRLERISELQEVLSDQNTSRRKKYKAYNKLAYLTRRLDKEPAFGGLSIQQCLTRECNKTVRNVARIAELHSQLRDGRIYPFTIVGEANQGGNRFFDLRGLSSGGTIIYKPERGMRISISVKVPKNYREDLARLAEMARNKDIAVSVRLSTRYICLSYDEERLNGFAVDERARRQDIKEIKSKGHPRKAESSMIKDTYRTYYDRQKEARMAGKLPNRCIAVDMNPTCVGYSILDRTDDGYRVVTSGIVDLSGLCGKTEKSSDSVETRYLNNKRRYELTVACKTLFRIAGHYQCSSFVIEELELRHDDAEDKSREANRQINNLWNRDLFTGIIRRRCNETGISLVEVNPCYSSFIGNIQHPYADAANASVEIGRRGLYKYEKGRFYPPVTDGDIRTLEAKFGDVVGCGTCFDWVNAYKSLRKSLGSCDFSHRLRAGLDRVEVPYQVFSMNSYKSRTKLIIFN